MNVKQQLSLLTIPSCQMEKELMSLDKSGTWPAFFKQMVDASNASCQAAGLTTRTATSPTNSLLNRYKDVLPWDQTRVRLTTSRDGNYINASHIDGKTAGIKELKRRYILAQAPLDTTVVHFWAMVWEQNVSTIVMLNRVVEQQKVKSAQYWPLGAKKGDSDGYIFEGVGLSVLLVRVEEGRDYVVSNILLRHSSTGAAREVRHFQYTAWPDFGTPTEVGNGAGFVQFIRRVRGAAADHNINATLSPKDSSAASAAAAAAFIRRGSTEESPLLIHCSAGIGRSGTFLLIHVALSLIEAKKSFGAVPDLFNLLIDLRKCRMGLIQTFDQMRVAFQTVVEEGKKLVPAAAMTSTSTKVSTGDGGAAIASSAWKTASPPKMSEIGEVANEDQDESSVNTGNRASPARERHGGVSPKHTASPTKLTGSSSGKSKPEKKRGTEASGATLTMINQRQYLQPL